MKQAILMLVVIISLNQYTNAQLRGECGTYDHENIFERLRINKKALKDGNLRSSEVTYLPIKFHRVAESNGDQRIRISAVLDQMCRLQSDYAPMEIVAYFKDLFNDLNNSNIFFNPQNASGQIIQNKDGGAVDIFITENADAQGATGTVLGYYQPGGDFVIIRKVEVQDSSATLSHELGHYLSLPHTHYPWANSAAGFPAYDPSVFGNPIDVQTISGNYGGPVRIELVDGSNCENSADEICDTPPDFCFPFALEVPSSGCNFGHEVYDYNGDLIAPMTNNTMGYFDSCDKYEFTPMQAEIMVADIKSNARNFLQSDYVPNTTEITDMPEIISPEFNTTVDFYNYVVFEWNEVENADYYLLEISSNGETKSYLTQETSISVTDLEPNSNYFWLLAPFNETSTCMKLGNQVFKTNNDLTSIETIENDAAQIHLFPNPVLAGQDVIINITSTKDFNAIMSLHNLEGKEMIASRPLSIQKNVNKININTSDFTPGVYVLRINSENGSFTQKVIIK